MFTLLPLFLTACAPTEVSSAPRAGRVDVPVVAEGSKAESPDRWCEAKPGPEAAPFALPALDGPAAPATGKARWVNVWATWCGPCIEEMPRLKKMQERLAKEGVEVELQFLSADEDAQKLQAWRTRNPDTSTMRVAKYADVQPWLHGMGLTTDTLPSHIFVGKDGRVSCVRAGAVEDHHYAAVKGVLSGG
jgi:thiol-disulfide isomerase/thioredoxin